MVAVLCSFADAPEERQRALHNAGHVLAPSLMAEEKAERRIDHVIERGPVKPARGGFLAFERRCVELGGDLGLDQRTGRPAEEGAVAICAHVVAGRIDIVRTPARGVEHIPPSLAGRGFLRPASDHSTPIGRNKIDVHTETFQQVCRHFAQRLQLRIVLSHEAGDRLTGIAACHQ